MEKDCDFFTHLLYDFHSESSSESSASEDSADEDPGNYNRYRSDSIPIEVSALPGIRLALQKKIYC